MMKTLITGGSGLLGSNLDIPDSVKPSRSELDLMDYGKIREYIGDNRIDRIIHGAALVGGVHANHSRLYEFFDWNLTMNLNVLRACKEFRLNNSIFILSTCILPAAGPFPLTERIMQDGEPHFTNYGYAYAKRMLEVGARCLSDEYGIDTTCLVPCNFYGPNDNHDLVGGHVIPSLIHKCYIAKRDKSDLIVWGSGRPEREFIHVSDLCRVIGTIHGNQTEDPTRKYPRLMIVSPDCAYTIGEVASLIADAMGFVGDVVFDGTKPDGILRKPTSNALFSSQFPDFSFIPLERGIVSSVEYFVNNYPNVRK